jgi:hypothetical protein
MRFSKIGQRSAMREIIVKDKRQWIASVGGRAKRGGGRGRASGAAGHGGL